MNRRAWLVNGYGVIVVLIEKDQIFISISDEAYEAFDRKLPEDI